MVLTNQHGRWVRRMRKIGRRYVRDIGALPNVECITVGEKRSGGRGTGEPAFIAYVSKKQEVAEAHRIPGTISIGAGSAPDIVKTDVVELGGIPRTLAARAGDLIFSGDGEFGTSCLTFRRNGRGYIATNAHVIANVATRQIVGIPALEDPETLIHEPLPTVVYASSFKAGRSTNEDLAILDAGGLAVDHLGILNESSPISRLGRFEDDLESPYWYNTRGSRVVCFGPEPVPVGQTVAMLVDGIYYPYTSFWRLQVQMGVLAPGHSGSIVCRGDGQSIVACGILFGGVIPNYAYIFPLLPQINQVLRLLP